MSQECVDGLFLDQSGMMRLEFSFEMWPCKLLEHFTEETDGHHEQGEVWHRRCSEYQKFISFLMIR